MEEVQDLQVLDYSQELQEIKESIKNNNDSTKELLEFFKTEKQEQEIKNQEEEKKQKQQDEKEQKQLLEEQKKEEEEQKEEEKQQEEFYSNIRTIATNTDTEVTTQLLTDVSTLMQVNIMTNGLLIGIVCISLFAKFFKK